MSENIELLSSNGTFENGRWTFTISARCLTPYGVDVLMNILGFMRSVMVDAASTTEVAEIAKAEGKQT